MVSCHPVLLCLLWSRLPTGCGASGLFPPWHGLPIGCSSSGVSLLRQGLPTGHGTSCMSLLWHGSPMDCSPHWCPSLSIGDAQSQSLRGVPALACVTLCDQHMMVHGLLPHRVPLQPPLTYTLSLLAITNRSCKREDCQSDMELAGHWTETREMNIEMGLGSGM